MSPLERILLILLFIAGAVTVFSTLSSVIRTFILPRGENTWLTRLVFQSLWNLFFRRRIFRATTYAARDRIIAPYAPTGLILLPVAWLTLVLFGYTLMFHAIGVRPFYQAFLLSGSSLFTLGFVLSENLFQAILTFSEATIGLGLVALLISYLPTVYAAFSRREMVVAKLEVRAGSPPSAVEMLQRAHRLERLGHLDDLWEEWENWFTDIEESHTSLGMLALFRSPYPDRSWVTAAGAIMDAAALRTAALDLPRNVQAELCIRAGYIALRRICDFLDIKYNPSPAPDDPISIARQEFDNAWNQLARAGLPMRPDREQAWRDFSGWRVNYDTVLLAIAGITYAPYAPWSSDRSPMPQRMQTGRFKRYRI